jgi:hypothetical protein
MNLGPRLLRRLVQRTRVKAKLNNTIGYGFIQTYLNGRGLTGESGASF